MDCHLADRQPLCARNSQTCRREARQPPRVIGRGGCWKRKAVSGDKDKAAILGDNAASPFRDDDLGEHVGGRCLEALRKGGKRRLRIR